MSFPEPMDWEELYRKERAQKTLPPLPHAMPREDLHALISLGYASKNRALREAAGRVDTWVSRLTSYLDVVRRHIERCEKKADAA
jgi:hypothetical protein